MNFPQFITYLAAMRDAISVKTDIDSISPTDVGETGLADLVAILDIIIRAPNLSLNNFQPTGGSEGDFHLQGGTSLTGWQKINSTWTNVGSLDLGISFPDGNSTLKTSLDEGVVTVTPGFWYLVNNQYRKDTQTQFNISAKDNTLETRDLIYANTLGQVLIEYGIPGLGTPDLPPDSVQVDVVIIPSLASGFYDYLAFGFTDQEGNYIKNLRTISDPDLVLITSHFDLTGDNIKNPFLGSGCSGFASFGNDSDGIFGWQEVAADDAPFRKKARSCTLGVWSDWVDVFISGSEKPLLENTSDASGEYALSGPEIALYGEYPDITIYDSSGLTSPAQYDNTNHKIIGLNPSETFKARFK